MIYFISLFLSLILIYPYNNFKIKTRLKKVYFIVPMLPLLIISAFRYDVGTDYQHTYVPFFNQTILGYKPYDEILFQLLNDLLVFLKLDVSWLFIITSLVINVVVFYYIFKYSRNIYFSVIIYVLGSFYFHSMNNVRQYMAFSFCMIGFYQRNSVAALILYIIGGLNHFIGFIFIPIHFFVKIKVNKDVLTLIFIIAIICIPLFNRVIIIFLQNTKYYYFLNVDGSYSLLLIILNTIITFIYIFCLNNKLNRIERKYFVLQLIATYFSFVSLFIRQEELWTRTIKVFMCFQIIALPNLITKKDTLTRSVFMSGITLLFAIYTIYTVFINHGYDVLPYRWIFNI